MSILIKNVEWSQTDDQIVIKLPLKGKKSLEDIIVAEKFIKVNISPFYYEVFFENAICTGESSCKLMETCIKFILKKANKVWWSDLGTSPKSDGKPEQRLVSLEAKKELLREYEVSLENESSSRRVFRANLKRSELDKEIKREQNIREKIDHVEKCIKEIEFQSEKEKVEVSVRPVGRESHKVVRKQHISLQNAPQAILPPVRASGNINVTFSSRRFITPKRESQEHAEREWCLKQHELKSKNIEFSDENLSVEERDPQWLLEKGNEFCSKNNYMAALSAYTSGIQISKAPAILLLSRAVAHFELQNYERCAEDCSEAFELITPAVPSNLESRVKCLWLRGKAVMQLGYSDHGFNELKAALRLDPSNLKLKDDILRNEIG